MLKNTNTIRINLRGLNYVRVECGDRIFIRLGYGHGWEAYTVEDGLEMFTGYLNDDLAAEMDSTVGMQSGPICDPWLTQLNSFGWNNCRHQALGLQAR